MARKRSIKVSLSKSESTDRLGDPLSDPLSDPYSGLLSGETFGQSSANSLASPVGDQQDGEPVRVTETEVLTVLTNGKMVEQGLLPYSSNTSFLITTTHNGMTLPAVYKPRRGENPLWDFEWGTLCQRETAAYLVSKTLGWDLVPPTVLREGTRGVGRLRRVLQSCALVSCATASRNARTRP